MTEVISIVLLMFVVWIGYLLIKQMGRWR